MRKHASPIPADLLRLKDQYKHWRKTRTGSNKTPPELWQQAAALSHRYGITIVSRQLGLNHVTLKAHRLALEAPSIEATALPAKQDLSRAKTHFVELPALLSPQQYSPSNAIQVRCQNDGSLQILLQSPQASDWNHLFSGFLSATQLGQVAR